jgi:hypothetical protein
MQPTTVVILNKYNQAQVVQVDKKYQCPSICETNHSHFVYYNDVIKDKKVMTIDRIDYKKQKKAYIFVKK